MARTNRKPTPTTKQPAKEKSDEPRLFIAAPLPNTVIDHLGQLLDDLSSRNLPVRWTAPSSLHLTLHFIGETSPERAELLRMSFANFSPKTGAIRLRTGRLGTFPNQKRPRVIWIGLEGQTDLLSSLSRSVATMLDRFDFPGEERSFKPHLTIGRARDGVDQLFPYQLEEAFASPSIRDIVDSPIEFSISEINLYRSHLEKNGARYESLASVPL